MTFKNVKYESEHGVCQTNPLMDDGFIAQTHQSVLFLFLNQFVTLTFEISAWFFVKTHRLNVMNISDLEICQKVARQLNVLRRISKFQFEETRLLVFKSFIRSNFIYCPIIWHFCSKVNTEKLQYRGLKIVYNCYVSSYEEPLTRVN